MRKLLYITVIFLGFGLGKLSAQCGVPISAFPYVEDFEAGQGGWTSGGAFNDWAWGHPGKPVITGAGSGQNCWIIGGLTVPYYSNNEASWVESPCFNFTSLTDPYITFLMFRESENKYDGANLQYSLDQGTTWAIIGALNDTDCMTAFWYNKNPITYLVASISPTKVGWCGNIQQNYVDTGVTCQGGGGTGRWVLAKHCLAGLAGQSSVKFRFVFGAGFSCNNFDGFAFDKVTIGEAPANGGDYTHTCVNGNTVSFVGTDTLTCAPTFAWNFGDPGSGAGNTSALSNPTHTFSAPGSYSVAMTISGGPCNAPATVTKTIDVLMISTATQNVLCNGGSTGSVHTTVTGGVAPYTYTWGGGQTTANLTGVPAGNYSVTVTDPNSCPVTISAAVSQPATLVATATGSTINCSANNGTINLTVTGGTTPYSYNWGGGVTTQNRTALSGGTYTVTVTDQNLCTATASAAVVTNGGITSVTLTATNVTCAGGADGSVNDVVTGGTTPYTYNWGGGVTGQNLGGVGAGNYTVTVTDNNGCTATATTTITQPAAITASVTSTNVSCNGGSDATINITPSGGTPNYAYNWGGGVTTQNRTALITGTYTVTITDNHNCTFTSTTNITQPSALVISPAVTNVSCNGGNDGAINITVTGGTSPYAYNWTGGIITQNRTGLGMGTFGLTVTDSKNCTATSSTTVTQPAALSVTAAITNTLCGSTTGAISLAIIGGTGAYSYAWSNTATTQNITSLAAGTYYVTVKDANNCVATDSGTVTQTNAPTVTATTVQITCSGANNGQINLTVNGGTSPYTYNWSDNLHTQNLNSLTPGPYSVTVTDAQNCTVTAASVITSPTAIVITLNGQNESCNGNTNASINSTVSGGTPGYTYAWSNGATTANISALPVNTYTLTVTDLNACTATASSTVTQPQPLTAMATETDATCFSLSNGTATLTVAGGTTPYVYAWSNSATTQNLAAVPANTYTVTVTDLNLCTATAITTVNQPTAIAITGVVTNATCFGYTDGSITLTVTGGVPAYSYLWNNGSATQNQANITNGQYQVSITDANSCFAVDSFTVGSPPQIIIADNITSVSCFGGSNGAITTTVTGGAPGYTYLWSDNSTNANEANITSGNYSVTVTDNSGCTAALSNIVVTQPSTVTVGTSSTPQSCITHLDGSASVTATGGTPPYNFTWSDGKSSSTINNLATGTYFVTVTDAHNCPYPDSTLVGIMPPLSNTFNSVQPICPPLTDGSITAAVAGGTPAYNYSWSNGGSGSTIANLVAGTYSLTVTDAKGCSITDSAILQYQYSLSVVAGPDTTINLGQSIDIYSIPNLPGGLNYSWTPADGLLCNYCESTGASPVRTTTYTITISDINGCAADASILINVIPDYNLFIPNAFTPNGDGNNDFFEIFGNKQAIVFWDIKIFDRWGEKVFESNDVNFTWDGSFKGKLMDPAVFAYEAQVVFADGYNHGIYKGSITLIR